MRDMLERHRSLKALVALAISALIIYIIQATWSALAVVGDVFLIFMLAWIITFILAPLSTRLERLHVPRIVAVSAIYLALLLAAVGIAALAAPALEAEVTNLAARLSVALSNQGGPNSLSAQLTALLRLSGFSPSQASSLSGAMVMQIRQTVNSISQSTTGSATQLLNTISVTVFDATLVVIISFYMMLSGDTLVEAAISRMPPKWLPDVRLFQHNINEIFAGFFRAQVIIGGIYAVMTWIILAFFGQGDAWFIALIAGALIWLPFIGPFLAVAPPLLLIAVTSPPNQMLLRLAIVGILLGAAQHIVLNVMAPRIFGQHMRVPTLILFAALMLGAAEGGVWGAFFAAPVIGVAYAMLEVFYERFSAASPLFQQEEEGGEEPETPHWSMPGSRERPSGGMLPVHTTRPDATLRNGASSNGGSVSHGEAGHPARADAPTTGDAAPPTASPTASSAPPKRSDTGNGASASPRQPQPQPDSHDANGFA